MRTENNAKMLKSNSIKLLRTFLMDNAETIEFEGTKKAAENEIESLYECY